VKMLAIPYKYLYPSAMFFVCIGVYAANNDFFQVGEVVVIGALGYVLLRLGFHPAPILLGFVLGPRFEENFRRAMLIARGDITVFITPCSHADYGWCPIDVESSKAHWISCIFLALCVLLIVTQLYVRMRGSKGSSKVSTGHGGASPPIAPEMAPQRIPVTPAE
jgi:putative tricarboxylic transport membrane protein